jgi:hypothetical protein
MEDIARLQQIAMELTKALIESRMKSSGETVFPASMIPGEAAAVAQAYQAIYQGVCAAALGRPKQ